MIELPPSFKTFYDPLSFLLTLSPPHRVTDKSRDREDTISSHAPGSRLVLEGVPDFK